MSSRDCATEKGMSQGSSSSSELMVRLVSALFLAALTILTTYWGGWPFTLLVTISCLILIWEWWRVAAEGASGEGLMVDAVALIIAVAAMSLGQISIAAGALALGLIASQFLCQRSGRAVWTGFGQVYIGLPALAIMWFRQDIEWGFLAVLFVFAVVWTTDSAAFFTGRAIGGPKLWPKISPNKTWAGFAGGLIAGALMGSLFAYFAGLTQPFALAAVASVLAVGAQGGDLLESGMKRAFGKKDASGLIPGHGGLFDRVDGLIVALLLAAAIVLLKDGQEPARSLLVWA